MSIAGVLLAAGAGARFHSASASGAPGSPAPDVPHKLLAPVRGRPVVVRALEPLLEAGLDEVVVVDGAVDLTDHLPASVTLLHNPSWAIGIASSLTVAVTHARQRGHEAVVVGLADQPGIPAAAWRLVAAGNATPIAVATYSGVRRNPVRLAAAVWDDLPTSGDRGARVLMRLRPSLVTEIPCPGDPGDVDTVEDLRSWI